MTINLATQLESILRAESDLRAEIGTLAAAPLGESAAARIRRVVANASPAVRAAMRQRLDRTQQHGGGGPQASSCVVDHTALGSTSSGVVRRLEQRGA